MRAGAVGAGGGWVNPMTPAELTALLLKCDAAWTDVPMRVVTVPRVCLPGVDFAAWSERMKHAPKTPASAYPVPPANQRTRDLREEDVLRLLRTALEGDMGVGHRLVEHGWHWKVVAARLGKMCDKGLIEYGTGLFTPWEIKARASR